MLKQFLGLAALLGIVWSAFQLYTAGAGFYPEMIQRPLHLVFALSLAFLIYPARRGTERKKTPTLGGGIPWYDLLLSGLALAGGAHLVWHYLRLETRIKFVDPLHLLDIVVALMLIALTFEACRRVVGWSLPIIAGVFFIYQFVGPWMPGLLRHTGISLSDLAEQQGLSVQGLFGIPTGVCSNYVFYFILFAAFMEVSGGGQLFIDLAFRCTGTRRGGPAKGAIVGSSLLGTISGSAVANVSGTGVFTIPLMKRAGYSASFAGAVEAVASTGGQLMPPIMGSAAFIMAEMVGIPYLRIALYAAIPAIAYYIAVFLMVDLKAKEQGLIGFKPEELPQLDRLKSRLVLLLPMAILLYYIFAGYSLQKAAFSATLAVVVAGVFSPATRMSPADVLKALEMGARRAVGVTVPAAAAGVVVGVVSYTGIGLKFSSLIIMTSGGYLVPALVLIMVGCIIMGMGMPTSGAYIMGAILLAPALQNMGVEIVPAHLFVLYFCALSMVTPPVALASYVAASISGAGIMETGWQALKLSLAGFIIPYAFVFSPAIVLYGDLTEALGSWNQIVWTSGSLLVGIFALAGAIIQHLSRPNRRWETVCLWASALLLISPELITDGVGVLVLLAVVLNQTRRA
ncbi:TRAP transporter permease [Acidobacteria bacterium AH-259-D05]|nr:TRAP transporter permease [Acidobacteria bacterium AH-259-D05]